MHPIAIAQDVIFDSRGLRIIWKACIDKRAGDFSALHQERAAEVARIAALACIDRRVEYIHALMAEAGGSNPANYRDAREMADLDEADFIDLATVIVAETRIGSR